MALDLAFLDRFWDSGGTIAGRTLAGSTMIRTGLSGSAAQRLSGSAAQRLSGSAAQRLSGSAAQRLSGSAAQVSSEPSPAPPPVPRRPRTGTALLALAALLAAAPALAQTPAVSSISFFNSPDSGDTYTRAEEIQISVMFDGNVEVSNRHLLRLALAVGDVTEQVEAVSGSARELIFTYTVKDSDIDADGISVPANPLSLNGGAITVPGDPDTAATLTHAGIAADSTRKVDGSQRRGPDRAAVSSSKDLLWWATPSAVARPSVAGCNVRQECDCNRGSRSSR